MRDNPRSAVREKLSDLIAPERINSHEAYVFRPVSSLSETKFHRGFRRRVFPQADAERNRLIDDAWSRHEFRMQRAASRARSREENIINGPLIREQPRCRKRILGPHTFDDTREILAAKRISDSSFRFYSPPTQLPPRLDIDARAASAIIGYRVHPRNRTRSVGIYDNFSHTQLELDPVPISTPSNRKNQSQFTLC